jgi:hypothetical protein
LGGGDLFHSINITLQHHFLKVFITSNTDET